jgi:glycosyltransferase involved in cell wall biosynthesis
VHAESEAERLKELIKDPLYTVTPHPVYNIFKFIGMPQTQARELLDLKSTDKVMLFFGHIRQYKGLSHLIKAMSIITIEDNDCQLFIVGEFLDRTKEEYMTLIEQCGCVEQCKIYDGYIPDREVEKFFSACDVVVLPYESATQSGVVQIAYGFEKPVIVTDTGGLPEVVEEGKTGYIVPPCDPERLAQAVIKFFAQEDQYKFTQNIKNIMYRFSWDRMLEAINGLYEKLTIPSA